MNPKAVLFDLDGVLIDSLECWFQAFNETIGRFGLKQIGREEFLRSYWGHSTEDNFGRLGLGEDAVKYCNSKHMVHTRSAIIMKGTLRTLEFVKNRAKVGLVTNTPRENTIKELEHFGLRDYFDAVVAGDDVLRKKPHPEMIYRACELLGVEPAEAVVVGDTDTDVKAGKSAGCTVVGINVPADFTINDLAELELVFTSLVSPTFSQ
jgi:HAD superfamily hydrolase (TIGR01509 family)